MAVVAHRSRTCANRRPDIGQRALLTDPGLILEPDLNRLAGGPGGQAVGYQAGEVFLNAACASASFLGW
jgi:hypothetical protein